MDTAKLIQIGGREWIKDGKHRVYFNDDVMCDLYGLKTSHYNTGNVSSASLNGEPISNSRARKILSTLVGKLWYDLADGQFHSQYLSDSTVEKLVAEITRRVNQ